MAEGPVLMRLDNCSAYSKDRLNVHTLVIVLENMMCSMSMWFAEGKFPWLRSVAYF